MKCTLRWQVAVLLCCCLPLFAQSSQPPTERESQTPTASFGNVDVLTDTMGVDFGPYLSDVLKTVRGGWYKLIPEVARPPIMKKGKVVIEFSILKSGGVYGMKLTRSSGDVSLDRAAWGGIALSNPFAPLPSEFRGSLLALRFNFYYNPDPGSVANGLSITPAAAEVIAGEKQRFYVNPLSVTPRIVWRLSGLGCVGSSCGAISSDGLYTAPSRIPNPPKVEIRAATPSDPAGVGVAVVTIVPPKPKE